MKSLSQSQFKLLLRNHYGFGIKGKGVVLVQSENENKNRMNKAQRIIKALMIFYIIITKQGLDSKPKALNYFHSHTIGCANTPLKNEWKLKNKSD